MVGGDAAGEDTLLPLCGPEGSVGIRHQCLRSHWANLQGNHYRWPWAGLVSGSGCGGIKTWGCGSPVPILPGALPGGLDLSPGEEGAGNVSEGGGPGTEGRGIGLAFL